MSGHSREGGRRKSSRIDNDEDERAEWVRPTVDLCERRRFAEEHGLGARAVGAIACWRP